MNLSVCIHLASIVISIPGKYFDYSNDEMEDDEEDFVKEKPTPAKHPKWYHIYYLILVQNQWKLLNSMVKSVKVSKNTKQSFSSNFEQIISK